MDKQLAESMGKLVREARRRARLTQADVAERLGIATEVFGRLERGVMLPSVGTLRKLSRALGVSADELLSLREPDSSSPPPSPLSEGNEGPEIRRLLRRAKALNRRTLRLLNMLAAALVVRGEKTA